MLNCDEQGTKRCDNFSIIMYPCMGVWLMQFNQVMSKGHVNDALRIFCEYVW